MIPSFAGKLQKISSEIFLTLSLPRVPNGTRCHYILNIWSIYMKFGQQMVLDSSVFLKYKIISGKLGRAFLQLLSQVNSSSVLNQNFEGVYGTYYSILQTKRQKKTVLLKAILRKKREPNSANFRLITCLRRPTWPKAFCRNFS